MRPAGSLSSPPGGGSQTRPPPGGRGGIDSAHPTRSPAGAVTAGGWHEHREGRFNDSRAEHCHRHRPRRGHRRRRCRRRPWEVLEGVLRLRPCRRHEIQRGWRICASEPRFRSAPAKRSNRFRYFAAYRPSRPRLPIGDAGKGSSLGSTELPVVPAEQLQCSDFTQPRLIVWTRQNRQHVGHEQLVQAT